MPLRTALLLPLLCILPFAAVWASQPAAAGVPSGELPEHVAEDPSAAPVTAENLMESERFWPYHVKLREAWQPPGQERPLRAGKIGVLLRVVDAETARIDFGRHGLYDMPVAKTNLLEEANRVRRGERAKMGPNFALALGPRLLQVRDGRLLPYSYADAAGHRAFLCVFADPTAEGFPELASALGSLAERPDVLTLLLPQGENTDAGVAAELEETGWNVAFVYAHLTAWYTRSLVGDEPELPRVSLQTNEGRLLFEGPWSPEVGAKLAAVMDDALGAATASASTAPAPTPIP